MITVTEVQALEDCRIRIGFSDGAVKEIDLSRLLANVRVVFIALRDPRVFKRVRVNPETRTVQWPGEVDLDPRSSMGSSSRPRVSTSSAAPAARRRTPPRSGRPLSRRPARL